MPAREMSPEMAKIAKSRCKGSPTGRHQLHKVLEELGVVHCLACGEARWDQEVLNFWEYMEPDPWRTRIHTYESAKLLLEARKRNRGKKEDNVGLPELYEGSDKEGDDL
ncbi:hypothetical protein [Actinomadura rubteroloni]|nr:hypothetical protein [Actinomadura rubteroloni]